ncbi:MAG: pilus assembly protein [Hyphomonadaceae bacterium]|nr:pilus assembly protein [Hyphomonadaceae bacterium]
MKLTFTRFARSRKGAALVEFSLLAPILVLLMGGLSEFANAMRQYHVMEKGVRDAGRYLTRVPMSGCTINGASVTAAQNLVLTGRTAGGSYFLNDWTDPSTVSVTVADCVSNSPQVYRGRAQMPVIEVTARAPYQDLGLLSVIGLDNFELEVSHQQLWIGH